MIRLILRREVAERICAALRIAGRREIGGVLMAEHTGPNEFEVVDLTVHSRGTFAYFLRKAEEVVTRLKSFFEHVNHDYERFNYAGEWHSHPSFELKPSRKDDHSMREIVQDREVGANFAALLIVKLGDNGELMARAYTYLPDGAKSESAVTVKVVAVSDCLRDRHE
jgi:[CysO sulfur-carrier protein]-S-L-cysteine hydrolase